MILWPHAVENEDLVDENDAGKPDRRLPRRDGLEDLASRQQRRVVVVSGDVSHRVQGTLEVMNSIAFDSLPKRRLARRQRRPGEDAESDSAFATPEPLPAI